MHKFEFTTSAAAKCVRRRLEGKKARYNQGPHYRSPQPQPQETMMRPEPSPRTFVSAAYNAGITALLAAMMMRSRPRRIGG